MSETIKIPDGWEHIPLVKACNVLMGQSPDGNTINQSEKGYPFLQGNAEFGKKYPSEKNWTTKPTRIAEKDSILLSVRAPVGELNIANKDYCIGRGLSSLTYKNHSLEYLYFAINHNKYQLKNLSQGSTFEAINRKNIEELNILTPKLEKEQLKIAEILNEIDNAISKTEEIFEKNKRLKTALMQDLLSYGINENGKVRNPQTHKFKPSELGIIPREWDLKSLAEISFLTSSKRVYFQEYTKSGIPFYRGKEITELKNNTPIEDLLYISREKYNQLKINFGVPCKNDILITAVGTLGNVFRVHDEREFYFKDGNLIWLKDIKIKSEFLEVSLNYNHNLILDSAAGSSQKALTIVNLKKIKIPVPISETEQQKIAQILSSQDIKIEDIKNKLAKLKSLKASLMQDLLSGRKRVTKLMEENS